jgi:hypothetical protein
MVDIVVVLRLVIDSCGLVEIERGLTGFASQRKAPRDATPSSAEYGVFPAIVE